MNTPLELVKDVAKLLENGHICYVEKQARKIHAFLIEEIHTPENVKLLANIERKIANYIKVDQMPLHELIFVMQDFLLVMTDDQIRKELSAGLKRNHPTRNFLQTLENRPDIYQHWRIYKKEQLEAYVADVFIEDYNY